MADKYDPLGIAKESDIAGYDPLGIAKEEPKKEGVWEGLVKPTLKATARVGGTAAGSLMMAPVAGISGLGAGTVQLAKNVILGGKSGGHDALTAANTEYERMMKKSQFIETPEEEQSLNYLNLVMKPFEMAGKGTAGLAELATTGDISKAADVVEGRSAGSNILVPMFGTIGEVSAIFGLPNGVGKAKNLVRSVINERKARVAATASAEAEATAAATRQAERASAERAKTKAASAQAAEADKAKVAAMSEPYDPLGIAKPDEAATAKLETAAAEATRTEPAGEPGRLATIYGSIKDKLPTWEADRLEGLVGKDPALWDAEDRLFAKDMEARYRGEEPAAKIAEPEYAGKRTAPERVAPMLTGLDRAALKSRGFSDEKIRKMSTKDAEAALAKPVELKARGFQVPKFPDSVLEMPEWAKKKGDTERSIIDQAAEEKQARTSERSDQIPAVRIDGKVYLSSGSGHDLAWDSIPAGVIQSAKTPIESGFASADGSGFTKKQVDLRGEATTRKVPIEALLPEEVGKEAESRAQLAVAGPEPPKKTLSTKLTGPLKSESGVILIPKGGFYSKLDEVVNTKMRMNMPVEQLRKMLLNNGVTVDEINTVLGGLKGTVSKKQVVDALVDNGTKFEDVVFVEDMDLADKKGLTYQGTTQYEQYSEPGYVPGSYRELFVTAPPKETKYAYRIKQIGAGDYKFVSPDGVLSERSFSNAQSASWAAENMFGKHEYDKYWNDGHSDYSDIQNPIVRIRYNEREVGGTPNVKVKSFEEFAKRFERTPARDIEARAGAMDYLDGEYYGKSKEEIASLYRQMLREKNTAVYNDYGTIGGKKILFIEEIQGPSEANQAKMPEALRKRIYDIGVKRTLALAKENGYDGVAWTTGDMQASRYNLSKQIDRVSWVTDTQEGTKLVTVYPKGHDSILIPMDLKGKIDVGENRGHTIDEVIGKELGRQILTKDSNDLSGLDLKVGGEGLKRLYDETIPGLMKKYGKEEIGKLDLQLEPTVTRQQLKIPGAGPQETLVSSIPITSKTPKSFTIYSDPFGLQAVGDRISSASSAIKEFVQDLKDAKLIVEPYDPHTFGDRLPDHQAAGIPEEAPSLSSTKDASRSADLLSPHSTFSSRFSLWDRPEIDMQKSHMASLENTKNSVAYVNNALKGVKDSFQDILKAVKPLFEKHKDLLERFETIQDQKSTLQRRLNKIPQSAEYAKLEKQTSKLARQRAKVQDKLDKKDTPESRDRFLFEKEQRTRYLEEQLASMKNEKAKLRKEGYAKALEKVKAQTYEKEIKDLMAQANRIDRAIELRSDKMGMIEYKLKTVKDYNKLKSAVRVLDSQAKELEPEFKAMSAEFDPMLKDLATKHADARVYLEASGELPEGVKLSKEEQHSADQLRKFMEDRRDKLEAVGIPVIREKAYMTHMWRQLLEDDTVLDMVGKFQEKPTLLRFMSRLPGSRPWLPSAHEAMRAYVPTVEYKLAYQPFLDRWRPFVDQIKQPRLKKFMNDWIESNMSRRDIGPWEKLLNVGVGIEYARTIGLSLSVGVKHGMKVLGTPAEYGFLNTLEALPQAAIVPYQAAMEFGKLHFTDFSKIAKDLGIGEKNDQLLLFRHYIAQSDLVRMMTEIPGVENLDRSLFSAGALKTGSATLNIAKKTIGRILAQPVKTVEALENGVSVFAGTIAGKAKGIDPLVIERRIWEAVFDVNFRSGVDQPLMQRKSMLGRAATMFQTTPLKLQERLYKWVHDSVTVTKDPVTGKTEIGKRDAFGTHGGAKLARFLLMVGTAELIARENDTSVLGIAMAHLPIIGEVLEPTKEGIGFKVRGLPGEPPLKPMTASPTTQFAYQIAQKGPYEGTREHLKGGFNFLSKIHKAGTEEYPTKYDSATKYMLGLPRIAGENDLETVTEKQKEERKDQTEHITELAAKFARGDDEVVDQALDYIATQPEEEQENLAKRFVNTAKIHTTTTHKWWQGLQTLSPENKAKVFYEKYKNSSEEVQDQMLEDASKLSGFTSERFEEAMRKEILKGEEKEEGEAMKPKGKFSIRPGTKNEATVYD